MKLTIEELAGKVNEQLSNLLSKDKRFSSHVSARRIRDYISKGVLDKPFKDGKNIYFTELHYKKLIALREIQSEGISEENLKKFISLETNENDLQASAFSAINEIMVNNSVTNVAYSSQTNNLSGHSLSKKLGHIESLIDNSTINKSKDTREYITKSVSKMWSEIPLLNNNKVFLRAEGNISFSEEEKKEILNNIQKILGIK